MVRPMSSSKKVLRLPKLNRLLGESDPMLGFIYTGHRIKKHLSASREGDILLTQAEKFATANALIDGSFKRYPENDLQSAWLAKIYPDHGFGGKGGDITDNLFLQKYLLSQLEARKVLDNSLKEIAGKINFNENEGTPIVVFNSLSWERTDPVDFEVKFEQERAKEYCLV